MNPLNISIFSVSLAFVAFSTTLVYFFLLRAYRIGRAVDRLMWKIDNLETRVQQLERYSEKSGFHVRGVDRSDIPEGLDF